MPAGFLPGHDAFRRRNDRYAEAAVHARNLVPLHVHAEARLAHPLESREHRLLAAAVAQIHLQVVERLPFFAHDAEVANEAFVFEDARDGDLHFRRRDENRIMTRLHRVADARQHIGDGVIYTHSTSPLA